MASKRKEKSMTQKELGLKINVSDKTISKWESGLGLPDISSIESLANVLDLNVNEILTGDVNINDNDMANMKRTKFYFCGKCGNIIGTNNVILNCCGQN
ncbi:MAG: helix-turn-helix domain-containing protein [Paeniclostridium sp.]